MTSLNTMNKAILFKLVAFFIVLMTSSHGQSETIEHEAVIVEFDGGGDPYTKLHKKLSRFILP